MSAVTNLAPLKMSPDKQTSQDADDDQEEENDHTQTAHGAFAVAAGARI